MHAACESADACQAVDAVCEVVLSAAQQVGMRMVPRAPGLRPTRRRHHPWFDEECRAAKAALFPLHQRSRPEARAALHTYRQLVRRKRRRFQALAHQQLGESDANHRRWLLRALRPARAALPPVPPEDMSAHFAAKYAGPGVTTPPEPPVLDAAMLQDCFSEDRVRQAQRKLRPRAAPGSAGIPGTAVKHAVLTAPLGQVFQVVAAARAEPRPMGLGLLTPALKPRGDALACNKYRGLVVSGVMHKLYALCVLQRLLQHVRGPAQQASLQSTAGFLPGRGPLFVCFALMHMVHHTSATHDALHAVFLDVSGAYDTVDHDIMVSCLRDYQVPPTLVHIIMGMYSALEYAVTYVGGRCPAFPVGVGVKQGCPLSPLLYAIYVSCLGACLQQLCPQVGFYIPAADMFVREVFYADDITLFAKDREGAQQGTAAAVGFLGPQRRQHLGLPKCSHMVFGGGAPAGAPLVVDGQQVPEVQETRLLGLVFDAAATHVRMATDRANIYASQFGVVVGGLRASGRHKAHSLLDVVYLLKVVAESAGLYGCGLWGVFYCSPTVDVFYGFTDPLERRRCRMLCAYLRLPKDTPKWCLLHELGLQPMVHRYVLSAVKLYNAMVNGGPMYLALLKHNIHDGLERLPGVRNWAYHLYTALVFVCPRGQWRRRMLATQLEVLPVGEIRRALREHYNTAVSAVKLRQPGQSGSWRGWYFREVCTHPLGTQPVYLRRRLPYRQVVDCLRFRLGAHSLQVRLGRHVRPVVPRSRRYCLRCLPRRCVDDEAHCLYHCAYPPLVAARARLGGVTQGLVCRSVSDLFNAAGRRTGHVRRVVSFLALCYRVAWSTRMAPLPGVVHSDDEELEEVDFVAFFSGSDDDFYDDYEDGLEPVLPDLSGAESEPEGGLLPDGVVLPDDLYD